MYSSLLGGLSATFHRLKPFSIPKGDRAMFVSSLIVPNQKFLVHLAEKIILMQA